MGRFFPFFFSFLSRRTRCSVPGQGSGKTPLSEAQGCRRFVVVQFRPADALLSPEPGGRPVYGSVCHLLCFARCICSDFFFFFFRLKPFSPSGAAGVDTFHPGYSSFPRLTPRLADGPREVFSHDFSLVLAPVVPSISTRARLAIVPFLWLVYRKAFPAPPATPAACGRF